MIASKLLSLTIVGLFCLKLSNGALPNSPFSAPEILRRLTESNKLPNKISNNEEYFPFLNSLIFQVSTAVLQVGKVTSAISESQGADSNQFPIPIPLEWEFTREYCNEEGVCDDYLYKIHLGGTEDTSEGKRATTWLHGAGKNDVDIKFGHNNFSYRFTVPEYKLNSSDFHQLETRPRDNYQLQHRGLIAGVSNTTLALQFNFQFSNGRFSVSNLDLTLEYGTATFEIPHVAEKEEGKEWRDLGPLEVDVAPVVMNLLKEKDGSGRTLEQRYEAFLEGEINQLLSGRS